MLDRELPEKIALAKKMKFNGIGFASNCTELDEDLAMKLLSAGLDTLICSVDGASAEVHESIRVGTDFEQVVANIKNFLRLRNKYHFHTRVLLRFIRQKKNHFEWDAYYDFWNALIDRSKNDAVLSYPVHNGDSQGLNKFKATGYAKQIPRELLRCNEIFTRMHISADGSLRLCCADDRNFFPLGNALESDPIELWNSGIFEKYRKAMASGALLELDHCSSCSIIYSELTKSLHKVNGDG